MTPALPRCMTTPLDIPFLTSNPQASPPISRTEQTNTCLQGLYQKSGCTLSPLNPKGTRASRPPARHETRPLSCTETPYPERQTCVLTQVRRYTQKAPRQSSIVKELSRKPITRSLLQHRWRLRGLLHVILTTLLPQRAAVISPSSGV